MQSRPEPSTESSRPRSRLRFLLTPRWLVLEAAVIVFVLACYFLLAPWQFARSHQHDAEMNAIATAVAAAPADVASLLHTDAPPSADAVWRTATATGHFDEANIAYVRLRQDNDGQPAYEVVVPFLTPGGTVLVDRGYVPYQAVQENTLQLPPLPTGTVTVTGRVQPDQTDPRNRKPVTVPDGRSAYTEVSSANVRSAGGPVYRGFLQLVDGSPGVIDAIALPQSDNSRPFFSYAIQWLSFGAIAVAGLAYFAYREYHDPVDGSIYLNAGVQQENEDRDSRVPVESGAAAETGDEAAAQSGPAADGAPKRPRFDKSQLYDG